MFQTIKLKESLELTLNKIGKVFIALSVLAITFSSPSISEENDAIKKGRKVFLRCMACHDLKSPTTKVGPSLNNIIGRKAGSLNSYNNYSKSLIESNIIWDEESLNQWFINPLTFLPGNKMTFSGIFRKIDRKNIIAFFKENKNTP